MEKTEVCKEARAVSHELSSSRKASDQHGVHVHFTKWVSVVNRAIWTCCIATIRAASIGLDKLTNSKEAIPRFLRER